MSHHFASGVMYGQPAWHGLGTTLPEDAPERFSAAETMKAAGLEWSVGCESLYTATQDVDGWQAVVRKDTGRVLGVVGDRYRPLQNADQFEFFQPWLDSRECQFETAGSLKGGSIVWVLAKLCRDDAVVTEGDTVKKYLLLASSHDGTLSTHVGFSPVRVVCWNTLSAAIHGAESKLLRVRHTARQKIALATIRETIQWADGAFEATAAQYRRLLAAKVNRADVRQYVAKVLDAPESESEWSTRLRNQISEVCNLAYRGRGNQEIAGTVWAAYNGVTEYLSHEYGNSQDSRLRSLWFGSNRSRNERAFELALQLAS